MQIPEWVVSGMGARDRAIVNSWWLTLPTEASAELLKLWDEQWPERWTSDFDGPFAALIRVEEREQAAEHWMWRAQFREYVLAHTDSCTLAWMDVFPMTFSRWPVWERYRRFQPNGEPAIPPIVQSLSWKRTAGQRFRDVSM